MRVVRHRLLIFKFYSWICEKTSKFWAASCKINPTSCLFGSWFAWILSSYWLALFYLIKNSAQSSAIFWLGLRGCWNSLLTSRNPKNNWCLSCIFGARFDGKDRGLRTCKLWSRQAGGWIHYCILKGTQDWEFFWLRFWNLRFFFVNYLKILRFYQQIFLIGPLLEEVRFFRVVLGLRGMKTKFWGRSKFFIFFFFNYGP